MWRETAKHARNRKIWDEEFEDFVPERVLDFHVHLGDAAMLPPGVLYDCAGHPIPGYPIEELERDLADAYPGRRTAAVCFGFPDVRFDRAANDRYVAAACDSERFFPFRLLDPAEPADAVREDVERNGFRGLKPYLNYVRKADPADVEVREMLPEPVMAVADALGLIVMLHVPRPGRLADPLNQAQVIDYCRSFPNAKIVLAHIGRAYFLRNAVGQVEKFADLPNCYLDLAMLNHAEVIEHAFRVFPAGRILFATDAPIAWAAGKSVEINHQYTYVTATPWKLSISDDHRKLVFTSFCYEELRAIRRAVERIGLGRGFVEDLFFNNGMRLLGAAAAGGKA